MAELIKFISILVANLPHAIKLIEAIERARAGQALNEKVASDKRKIEEAFRNRDSEALRLVFRS